jgi:HSP20 family molecular chaperone IbpA
MSERAPERRPASPERWEPRRELEQMTEGVLTVRVPKSQRDERRQIEIKG